MTTVVTILDRLEELADSARKRCGHFAHQSVKAEIGEVKAREEQKTWRRIADILQGALDEIDALD